MLDPQGRGLRDALLQAFAAGVDPPADGNAFDALALDVFAYAYHHIPPYRAYCHARGRDPGAVSSWLDVPAVPTAAFKELPFLADGASAERVFRTSGTTRGLEQRGEHHVADLDLYRASLRPTFRAFLLPDDARLPFFSLMPPAARLRSSSLAFMIDDVAATFGAPGSAGFADEPGIDYPALDRAVEDVAERDTPVLLLGTSAAFIHWLDHLAGDGRAFRLPRGSRIMDTGGYKGRGRAVTREELASVYARRLGIDPVACVNEYGMTELLSQLYDRGFRDRHRGLRVEDSSGPDGGASPRKQGPWWLRSTAVDPDTLEPLPAGHSGLLRHFDLANLGTVPAVQTEDFGRVDAAGLVLTGRATGAPPRGCSIAMDLLLDAEP